MSEHTDVDVNNLCITEEVFEKFQSDSMYEEEELITLSDLLPSSGTAPPSVPDDAKDLLTDENVVLDINQSVNSVKEISPEIEQQSEISALTGEPFCGQEHFLIDSSELNLSETIEVQTEVVEEKQPKTRGRRKKTVQEAQNKSYDNAHTDQPEQLPPRRRGRRKNNLIDTSKDDDLRLEEQVAVIQGDDPEVSSIGQTQVGLEENTKPQSNKKRGRGRNPKMNTSVETNGDANFTEKLDKNNQDNQAIGMPVRKRGRKRKTLQNDNVDDNIEKNKQNKSDDTLLEGLSTENFDVSDDEPISHVKNEKLIKMESENVSVITDNLTKGRPRRNVCKTLTETNIENNDITSVKKKRRSKKQSTKLLESEFTESKNNMDSSKQTSLTEVEEPSSTVEKEAEPDQENKESVDEMSLSTLKLTLVSQDASADNTSSLKEDVITSTMTLELEDVNKIDETTNEQSSKLPELEQFENNLDNVSNVYVDNEKVTATTENNEGGEGSLLIEDTSKRPKRRKTKQNFRYQEDSDEDPFANVELSDDEPRRGKRGTKYYSDDEYIPGKKSKGETVTSDSSISSDIDAEDFEFEGLRKQKRKRFSKKIDSPKKSSNKTEIEETLDVTTVPAASTNNTDDIESCLESSVIKNSQIDETAENKSTWGTTNAFESFLAQKIQGTALKIKKVSSTASATSLTPLDIPTLDPTAKKLIDISTQTSSAKLFSLGVQTSPPYDIPMKENVVLTKEQSEKACEFLNSIVQTTSELGVLMTQKSEDFMKKKINTDHVKDTFKMDYCVRKSFLLFKLAKHNLMQMEEDLANQYEAFLKANDLINHREQIKTITSTSTQDADNDSDCEIVDVKPVEAVATEAKNGGKSKINPKTVFLNKELSIKITKKPSDDKKLNIKGRHTVWINDSVILKKVKPTQSFLAQDSRNKKPPDSILIEKIVYNFFKEYNRQQAMSICAPFISPEWVAFRKEYACYYFVASPELPTGSECFVNDSRTESVSDINRTICDVKSDSVVNISSPKSLFSLCALYIQKLSSFKTNGNIGQYDKVKMQPQTLLEICIHVLNKDKKKIVQEKVANLSKVLPLTTICYNKMNEILKVTHNMKNVSSLLPQEELIEEKDELIEEEKEELIEETNPTIPKTQNITKNSKKSTEIYKLKKGINTLFSICVKFIQNHMKFSFEDKSFIGGENNKVNDLLTFDNKESTYLNSVKVMLEPQSLKSITYDKIVHLLYKSEDVSKVFTLGSYKSINEVQTLGKICLEIIKANLYGLNMLELTDMTINSVNMLSEEAFLNIENTCTEGSDQYQYPDDDSNCFEDEFEPEYDAEDTNETTQQENNWVNQVQMKELISCHVSNNKECESINDNPVEASIETASEPPFMVNIKSEPLEEELTENMIDPANVKTEPSYICNEFTVALESVVTKTEQDNSNAEKNPIQRSSSYDGDTFEKFASTNKMIHSLENYDGNGEIFSQSALRIRRQFDPDWDDENDGAMSLLVPHTYEPMKITEAKDTLMESSSDESRKDASTKKKTDRRRKKTKKVEIKSSNNKDIAAKNKTVVNNEVAILTRRMRERLRQEEKKVQSSDSENEPLDTVSKNDKKKGKAPATPNTNQKSPKKYDGTDIQCNNVDSTEQLDLNGDKSSKEKESVPDEIFTGFTSVDQSEISTYQKYLKDVYDKILPKMSTSDESKNNDTEVPLKADDPVEYLECEPTLPIFDKQPGTRSKKKKTKESSSKGAEESILPDKDISESKSKEEETVKQAAPITESPEIIDRHGWQCYPIDANDRKLYENCQILLDKLPEAFVDMYFQYQNITKINKEDEEVDRLTNLQSLKRTSTVKELKSKGKSRDKTDQVTEDGPSTGNDLDDPPDSPGSDRYHELTPSEDDGSDRDDEALVPIQKATSENNIAKSSLMDDQSDSDTENTGQKKIKKEPTDDKPKESKRPGPKSKTKLESKPVDTADLMLTADKMMNKELTLLHAPINLDETAPEIPSKKPSTRNKSKNSSKKEIHYRIKNEDDSSSEEEKQWVTTKEKLLKRLEKKHETTLADEAKRTKIVSEYIERRGEMPEPRLQQRRRTRRSAKKMLERQKQLRVLTRELLGEAADTPQTKRYTQAYFNKGRRNIRKVIDKKSLARSTVRANMEEFERKRRLNMKQVKLRELLGCDEGVNVLVINDELCLEYDFEQQQPVVSVHPFFTKIMKAHQYEGVKFMWDACFESLSQLSAGNPGGGCILAHCMGLGKTLQVLALLHTVLTHPGTGMQRVLVCCPLSTVLNWVDEIHKWIGPVTDQIKVFELSKLKKTYERAYQLEDWYSGGGIFIIGYELFRSLTTLDAYLDDIRPTILKKIRTALLDPGPDIIICDEGHLLKNDCSVLAVAMSRVATKRRIVLTGTPMQNNLREYYCMVNFVKPDLLGTYSEYSNRFENPIMNGQHRDSSEEDIKLMKARTHILHKVLEGCLQRQEASVLYPYLPKKHEYTVFISLTKCQWDMYKYYLMHYANKAKHGVLKDFHILQKVWSHPQVLHHFHTKARDANLNKVKAEKLEDDLAEEDTAPEADLKPNDTDIWWLQFLEGGAMLDTLESSNKFVVVFRILEECVKLGDKVLIFSTSLFTMDALEFFLRKINKWSLGQDYYRLDGSVPAEVRQKWCREFNAENNHKTKLFLISTRAGSLGLNMTAANRVIILDTSWNPAHDIQSIFRVYRFGQKKDCYIYRLVALGTMEQKIYERSVTKQAVACRVVDEQQIDRHYNMHELTELYRFDESGSGVASGVAAGVRDVALLRVARLRALHAVHEHDSLLRGSEPALPEHERQAAWSQFQLEHENRQLENDNVKVKKIALKRTHKASAVATAVKAEPGTSDDQDFKPKEPKAKRGRKSHVEPEESILPDQNPHPCQDTERINTLDPDTEQSMVKKITELLVKHKMSYREAQKAMPQIVANVRRVVMTGQDIALCDPLTASIARVLMQRQDNMSMPLVNGIIGESVNQTIPDTERNPSADISDLPPPKTGKPGRPKKYKPGPKCKKGYVYIEVPSTSKPPENVPIFDRLLLPNEPDGRTKRKAALAAEKLLDTAVEDGVIDLDDDDDYSSGTDTAPETIEDHTSAQSKPESAIKKPNVTITQTTNEPKARKSKNTSAEELEVLEDVIDTSILLSDDEERLLSTAVELEPEGEVSLHPSLLKNNNFIKIVAHTYLAGNPMLDEDAAMLAARYSTYKAVKELESTGKPITNGPIYDIAVQVLGKPILKKLHNTNHKAATSDEAQSDLLLDLLVGNIDNKEQPKTSETTTKIVEKPTKKNKAGPSKTETAKPEKPAEKPKSKKYGRGRKIYIESDDDDVIEDSPIVSNEQINAAHQPSHLSSLMNDNGVQWPRPSVVTEQHAPAQPQGVVPVGLFKTTVSLGPPQEQTRPVSDECILPDDEAVPQQMQGPVVLQEPALVPISKPLPGPGPAQKKPVIIKMVRASRPPAPGAPAPLQFRITSDPPVLLPAPRALTQTICLDSDDEDAPQPQPAPTVLYPPIAPKPTRNPVKLTKVDPSKILLTTKKSDTVLIENDQPGVRYVMIPSSQIKQMYSPLVPISANPMTSVPQGTITMQTFRAQNSNMSDVTPSKQKPSILTRAQIASTTVVRNPNEVKTAVSTPSLAIDGGRIINYTLPSMPNTTRLQDLQVTPPEPQVAAPSPAKPSTPAKPVEPPRKPSSSSDSDSDQSDTNDDPLSILKDVVHIQAPSYERTPSKAPEKSDQTSKQNKPVKNKITTKITPTKTIAKETPTKKTPTTSAPTKTRYLDSVDLTFYDEDPTGMSKKASSTKVVSKQYTAPKPQSTSSKIQISAAKAPSTSKPSTSKYQISTTKSPATSVKPKNKTDQLAGKVLQSSAKSSPASSKPSTSRQSISKPQTNVAMSSSSSLLSQKKRPPPTETAAPKKKKIDHLMTLKDFDIDDIDDIIELD